MNVKNIIRERRLQLGLTYEELGNIVGVGKSTVRKWETGMIENMRRDNIIALAKALKISPALIMGWNIEESEDSKEIKLTNEENKLLNEFNKLNDIGKKKAIDYTKDLAETHKYTYKEKEEYNLAAHDDNLDKETAKKTLEKAKAIFKQMDEEQ